MNRSESIRRLNECRDDRKHETLLALAKEMDANDVAADSPVREVFALLGDKWSKLILLILNCGVFGYGELQRTIEALASERTVSRRVLTVKLRALERDGFIQKKISEDKPLKSEYSLTPLGAELTKKVVELSEWITENHDAIYSARNDFDSVKHVAED